ncbi:MFS transporter, partial [uncultured Corynebacterium sp.]|uniref:MFS transporter n=1 Tax=uncultured Corynebacterium sp. TaxID=159447 RepID=UPI00342E5C73
MISATPRPPGYKQYRTVVTVFGIQTTTLRPEETMSKGARWSFFAVISSGLLMVGLEKSILYTALPALNEQLHTDSAQQLWIINAYALVLAGLLLGTGTLGDKISHRRMFVYGLWIFGAAEYHQPGQALGPHLFAAGPGHPVQPGHGHQVRGQHRTELGHGSRHAHRLRHRRILLRPPPAPADRAAADEYPRP